MPAITFSDFSGGLDRRLPISVQEGSRLWTLENASVTLGKRIAKRPGLRALTTQLGGSFGIEGISGRLKVFSETGAGFVAPIIPSVGIDSVELDTPGGYPALSSVTYADLFQGYQFVVAHYGAGATSVRHHYVDGTHPTYITDANCPHTPGVTKAASRVFAPGGEVVRYCKAGGARDWTTASDAGFLPAALQADTKSSVNSVGTFQDALVVFFPESSQIWDVAVDPSANKIRKRIPSVGCKSSLTLSAFSNDLMFLSPFGFRSMSAQMTVDRIDDTDVGVPVDVMVKPDLAASTAAGASPRGFWVHELGQYWCLMPLASTTVAWVYTYSKLSKIACWSRYTFPVRLTASTSIDGKVYLRNETTLYELSADQYMDSGTLIDVTVQMAFQDAKSPGVNKQFYGADCVASGGPDLSYLYDPRDLSKESIRQTIPGDSRPGDLIPVEISAPALAPVVRHSADEPFEFDALTLYYNPLGLNG